MQAVGSRRSARVDASGNGAERATPSPTRHLVRIRFMPGLDGLRALAVIAVVLYHAELPWIPGGFLGVDVFFVISGYLITSLLLAEFRNHGRISLSQFYLRRARRLLPALFLLLGVVSLYVVIFMPEEITKLRGDVVAALTYATNWWQIVRNQSYFEASGRPPLLRHLWSLAVEEQFYLVWPLLFAGMLKFWNARLRPLLFATLGGAAASTLLMVVLSVSRGYPLGQDPSRAYYGSDTRISTMLIGAALAIVWAPWRLSDRTPAAGRLLLDGLGLAGLAALIWTFLEVSEFSTGLYRGGFTALALVSAVVIAVTVHPGSSLGRLFAVGPLRWVGERSYGIYLWHWPIFMVTRPILDTGVTGTPNLVLRLALTAGVSELSFRYVEQPIRQGALGRWLSALRSSTGAERTRLATQTATTVGVVALGAVLMTVGLASGRPAPIPPGLDSRAAAAQTQVTPVTSVTTTATTAPAGNVAAPPPAPAPAPPPATPPVPRITAIGDSVMLGAAAALQQRLGDVYVDAAVSRQFGNAIDILRTLKEGGRLSDIVVVHMGTNGVITDGQMQAIMDILADRKRVVFLNLKVPRRWEGPDNAVLASWVPRYPNAVLINWNAEGNARPEFFYADGFHLRPDGARYYAELIAQQTAANP